jgi:intracellular sulfur oxidation DsrE/DsrF family protein
MKSLLIALFVSLFLASSAFSQAQGVPDLEKAKKDSVAASKKLADSVRFAKLVALSQYPLIKGSKWSGIIPVENPTEVPDPNRDYKLLFDIAERNPDSTSKEINSGLDEVARVLNLHVASGVSPKRLFPVIIVYGKALEAVFTNEKYRQKHSVDNPNLKIIKDLQDAGARIIACGQAMAFRDVKKDEILPSVKITLSAQTVFSNYELQGYVRYRIRENE